MRKKRMIHTHTGTTETVTMTGMQFDVELTYSITVGKAVSDLGTKVGSWLTDGLRVGDNDIVGSCVGAQICIAA